MKKLDVWNDKNLLNVLKDGGVVVMPTDTIYGIVGRAESKETVERIYKIRRRNPEKPCIILIGDINELEKFSVNLSPEQQEKVKELWNTSRPISIILDCMNDAFTYLHRGTQTLAFRLPAVPELRELLKETGPLIAPSANLEAKPPSKDINEAKKYFGDLVDLYIDGGELKGNVSKIIKLSNDGSVNVIRE
jgi:L-threonylcarbamoyladenylate synthase